MAQETGMPDEPNAANFQPDYTPEQLENLGVYDALYRGQGPRLASLGEWKPEWISEHDPKGWAQWYKRYASGRRIPEEDERQMKRWVSFKARHGSSFTKNPTPRRGWALRNWGIDPAKMVEPAAQQSVSEMLDEYQRKAMQKHVAEKAAAENAMGGATPALPAAPKAPAAPKSLAAPAAQKTFYSGATTPELTKQSALLPEVQLQEHQQRIQDSVDDDNPRMIVYHGLGSGKSLSALAAAEAAKQKYNDDYGIVAPASLRGNFQKEVEKFTTGSKPEIMSYTGLGLGKKFTNQPQTVIMDEAHRLRNPGGSAAQAAKGVAENAKRLLLLTGSPITNSPSDLANLISLVARKNISPQEFERRYVGYKTVHPGLINYLAGVKPGVRPVVKNEGELKQLLTGHVDYQPSKTPEGVNVNEEKITVPLSSTQQKIQKALRTKIPPGFLWKLDKEFPMSKDELAKLNSFLTGLRQNSVSPQPFRADKDTFKAFQQSGKLQEAYKRLRVMLDDDPRKKAIIYSNHIGAGLDPYSAALNKYNVPHGVFHGGIPMKARQQSLKDYNEGKLRALLIGPAGAEGLSTKGTNLIQLLDPHWHESRTQQARGRGLRFDSHDDLPEELKNVAVQRFISKSEEPSFLGKLMGYRRERTGDEILERLAKEKEVLNERFRQLLRDVGTQKKTAAFPQALDMNAAGAPKAPAALPLQPQPPSTPSPGFITENGITRLIGTPPMPPPKRPYKPAPTPASLVSSKAELKPGPVMVYGGVKSPEDTIRNGVKSMTGYDIPALSFSGPGRDPSQAATLFSMGMDMYNNGLMSKSNAAKVAASSPAWQRSAGKSDEGGLNAKGRASYNKATGGNLKAPVTESKPSGERAQRQNSFCSRMCGMKSKNTGGATAKDPDSRINKSLRKWNCKCGSVNADLVAFGKEAGFRWYKRFPMTENLALNLSLGGPSLTVKKLIPGTSMTFGRRAPRMYIGTPIPGLAYQQYLSPKKHKVTAEKEFKDDPDDQRTTYEKIRDFLFGSEYGSAGA